MTYSPQAFTKGGYRVQVSVVCGTLAEINHNAPPIPDGYERMLVCQQAPNEPEGSLIGVFLDAECPRKGVQV